MTSSSVPTLRSNVSQFGSSNRCNQHVKMRSYKILILALYFIIMGFNATAFDDQVYTENTPVMSKMQKQYHESQSQSNMNNENVTVHFWAYYLAKCSSSVNDFVDDLVFHLQHMPSSFPLSALEIFCLVGVCLSFTAVMVIISLIERLIERITALETENAKLRDNVKMNKSIVIDIVSEKKNKIIPGLKDLRDRIQRIEFRQNLFSDYRTSIDTSMYNVNQELQKLTEMIQELQNKQLEELTSGCTDTNVPNNKKTKENENNNENVTCNNDSSGAVTEIQSPKQPKCQNGKYDGDLNQTQSEQTTSEQSIISVDELIRCINHIIQSCNNSHLKIEGLHKLHDDLYKFVDLHFSRIYSELSYIAERQRTRSDETLPFGESEV